MFIAAIDPGSKVSAVVTLKRLRCNGLELQSHGREKNDDVVDMVRAFLSNPLLDRVIIEQLTPYGQRVGNEVFDTIFWSGRFFQAAGWKGCMISRKHVSLTLTGVSNGGDARVRAAVLDAFGLKSRKLRETPLAHVARDEWQALGVALAWMKTFGKQLADARKWGGAP